MERIGICTGSGIMLESLLDVVEREVSFRDVPGLFEGGVAGHRHVFLQGFCGDVPVILQSGRLHFYEGFNYWGVTRPVDVLHSSGARKVLFVNAAGGLEPSVSIGDLIAVDRVRLWRYGGWDATPGMLFPDFVIAGCDFTGSYQWVHGPSYETRAEIAAMQNMKVWAVGMSAGPELARCQELGMRGGVLACVTNCCYKPQVVTHEDVIAVASRASARLACILRRVLPEIAAAP